MHRTSLEMFLLALLLLVAVPGHVALADEDRPTEPPPQVEPGEEKQAEALTESEREARKKRAQELTQQAYELYRQGRHAEAVPLAREVLEIMEADLGPDHLQVAEACTNLARVHRSLGQYGKAGALFERAGRIHEKALGPDAAETGRSLSAWGRSLVHLSRYGAAKPQLVRALEIRKRTDGLLHPNVAVALVNLGGLLIRRKARKGGREPSRYGRRLTAGHPATCEVVCGRAPPRRPVAVGQRTA